MPAPETLRRVSVFLTGLLAACDAFYLPSVNGPLKRVGAVEYARAHNAIARVAGKVAPAVAAPLLLTDVALISKSPRPGGGFWVAASLLFTALNAAITFAVNVPVNREFERDTTSPPEDWEELRDRWKTAHNIRTAAQVIAFALSLTGYVKHPPHKEEGR